MGDAGYGFALRAGKGMCLLFAGRELSDLPGKRAVHAEVQTSITTIRLDSMKTKNAFVLVQTDV